jgi:anti-sigma B factor antagonist
MSLRMQVEELTAGKAVITMDGALILGSSLRLADSQLQSLIAAGTKLLLLDLSGVPYCDSSGLGAMVHTAGLAKQQGGAMRICGLSDRVANMLKITTIDRLLSIDADRASGLAALDLQSA